MAQGELTPSLFWEGCLKTGAVRSPVQGERLGWRHFPPQHQHGGTSENNTASPSGGKIRLHQTPSTCAWQLLISWGKTYSEPTQ